MLIELELHLGLLDPRPARETDLLNPVNDVQMVNAIVASAMLRVA